MDPTCQICIDLLKPFGSIPNRAQDLVALVDEPLLVTLPIIEFEFNAIKKKVCKFIICLYYIIHLTLTSKSCQYSPIVQFLHPANGELSLLTSSALAGYFVGDSSDGGRSEDMLHFPIDVLVRHTLTTLRRFSMATLPILMDRNKKDGYGFTSSFDHDLSFYKIITDSFLVA